MTYEIGQLDVPDRQLLPTSARSRTSFSTEIGEAIVTHTIFGRAKVRIVRKHDKMRRTLWLMALLGVTVAAAAAWQGWMAAQQTEPVQAAEPPPALSTNVPESVLAPQTEYLVQPAAVPPVESKLVTPPQAGTNDAPISQKPAPLGANDSPAKSPADVQQPPKPAKAKQPVTVAKPRVTQPVTQPAASSPAAVTPLAVPLDKEDAAVTAPDGNKQAADPVNAQP
jgi:cytoskeletal protein RodZ